MRLIAEIRMILHIDFIEKFTVTETVQTLTNE